MSGAMTRTVRQIEVGGRTRTVREEPFEASEEHWNEYKLENGDLVRMKIVVHKIFGVLDSAGSRVFTADGDPEVVVRHQVHVSVSSALGPDAEGEPH